MSKELTEQWRNGTLEDGFYYVKENNEVFISPCSKHYLLSVMNDCEVLSKVPTYDQFVELTEKAEEQEWRIEELEQQNAFECGCNQEYITRLKEAEEALKDFCDDCTLLKCGCCDEDCAGWKARQYLKKYSKR